MPARPARPRRPAWRPGLAVAWQRPPAAGLLPRPSLGYSLCSARCPAPLLLPPGAQEAARPPLYSAASCIAACGGRAAGAPPSRPTLPPLSVTCALPLSPSRSLLSSPLIPGVWRGLALPPCSHSPPIKHRHYHTSSPDRALTQPQPCAHACTHAAHTHTCPHPLALLPHASHCNARPRPGAPQHFSERCRRLSAAALPPGSSSVCRAVLPGPSRRLCTTRPAATPRACLLSAPPTSFCDTCRPTG